MECLKLTLRFFSVLFVTEGSDRETSEVIESNKQKCSQRDYCVWQFLQNFHIIQI